MANSTFHRVQSKVRELKILTAKVSIGASGAPTLTSSDGVASIVRDSAGVYIVTLDEKFNELHGFHPMLLEATAEDLTFQVESEDVDGAKTIQFQCKAADVETDPSDGSALLLTILVKNSGIK